VKTNKEIAGEIVNVVVGLLAIMQPRTKDDFDRAMKLAGSLVETQLDIEIKAQFESAARQASEAMEGK